MDTLLRGNVQDECAEDTADYDRHMNQFSRYIAAGIFTVILGLSANQFLEALEVPEQIDAYHHKFPVYIVAGIACVLATLILSHARK